MEKINIELFYEEMVTLEKGGTIELFEDKNIQILLKGVKTK